MGEGMDVVLILFGNEINVVWECFVDFGCFVEI